MADPTPIRVEVPVCAFRPYASREYQDTFPVPPPATVYGMLLSLLGIRREDKERHRGVEMALAIAALPEQRSRVFRKLRRGDDLEDTRPDYQDLLIDLTLWVWLRQGADPATLPLCERVQATLTDPASIKKREGGLSLGESSYLVDVIKFDPAPPDSLIFLMLDERGFYSLPVWVDHSERDNTVVKRFRFSDPMTTTSALANPWIRIGG